jgi:hypothetical protein
MTRLRKTLKSHRKHGKKSSRRNKHRGGQLTPLSDISTNSSLHDLDDLDEPSNNTTSESMLSDAALTPESSGPISKNLLGQFNAATDESLNLSNNTTAASNESSENSFSDVESSFGHLGHGGKKKMKGEKKTRRGESRCGQTNRRHEKPRGRRWLQTCGIRLKNLRRTKKKRSSTGGNPSPKS